MSALLELKIKSFVEGLENVTALAKELGQVGESAQAAGKSASAGKAGFTELRTEADAYKTIGVRSFAEVRAEIAKVTAAHQQLTNAGTLSAKEQQAVTDATRTKLAGLNAELRGVAEKNTDAAGSGDVLNKALGVMGPQAAAVSTGLSFVKDNVGALIGAFTALALAYGLKESAEYAARTETLGITMNVVAKNAGYSAEEIGKYEKEVKGLGITTQGTRESITQMIQAGLEIGPTAEGQVSQVAKLARAAQDLAVVTGENSSATLTRLITNISQLDTVGLRYMGLTVNVEAAEQQFAISIGKTVDQLTQKQKAQAVMDESLRQAEKLNGAYEASMDSVGKKVQSLKRYQEELANDIGSKLLPAYGALVDSATNFLKVADTTAQGIDRSGASSRLFAEGVTTFGSSMGNALNTVLGMIGEIYPTLSALGKGFLDLLGYIINVATEILTLGHYTDEAGNKFTVLGQTIKLLIGTVALVLAGLKDGIDIITATIFGMGGAAIDIVGKIISAFGKMVSYINKDWGKAIQGVGDSLQESGKNMIGFADTTVDQFARGESAVGKYRKSLRETELYTQQLKQVTDFSKAEAEVLKMAEAVRKNGSYTKEFADQSEILNGKLKDMQAAGQLSTAQLGELQAKLQRLSSDDAANFTKAINDAGLKLVELAGQDRLAPLNKEFDVAKASVVTLGSSTKTTASVMNDAFSKGIDAAKTLAELKQIGDSLGDVKKVTGDIKPALIEAGIKFDELFEKSLKAAKTDKDFADLIAEVQRLGKAGVISGDAMSRALREIEEKATGAEAALSRLAKRAAEIARSEVDLARAHLDMIKAQADLGRASLDVMVKQISYAKEGSELAKEELKLAQLNKDLATEKAKEAKASYDVAIASHKLLISLQQKLNAEKEAELQIGKEGAEEAKQKAQALADQAREAENAVNWARQALSEQQKISLSVEEQVVQQKLVVDTVKVAAEQAKELAKNTGDVSNGARTASDAIKPLVTSLNDANKSADELTKKFAGMTEEQKKAASAAAEFAAQTKRTEQALQGVRAAQDRLDSAEGVSKGVTTTGGNGRETGGVDGVRDVEPYESASQRNARITKETNAQQEKNDAINHTAGVTDNDIATLLWDSDHGVNIPVTAENLQRAKTAYEAASANLQMYQMNAGAFSNAGADSIMRAYNRARVLLDKMQGGGLNDGSGGTGGLGGGVRYGFGMKIIGSHKTGLDRVPYDGYVAELHEDEKVLTAKEADQYRRAPSVSDLSRQLIQQISSTSMSPRISEQMVAKGSTTPVKTIQVNFTDGNGQHIPMTTEAGNEQALLDLLKRAKGVAS